MTETAQAGQAENRRTIILADIALSGGPSGALGEFHGIGDMIECAENLLFFVDHFEFFAALIYAVEHFIYSVALSMSVL
jgi:hypothetical protein